MYTYIYTYVYTHIYAYIHILHIFIYIYVYKHIYASMCMYMHIFIRTRTYICMYNRGKTSSCSCTKSHHACRCAANVCQLFDSNSCPYLYVEGRAACCSVLQCVAVCCSVLQRVAACCSVLQRECLSVIRLQLLPLLAHRVFVVCCSVSQHVAARLLVIFDFNCISYLYAGYFAACCSVLLCVAACCCVLQCECVSFIRLQLPILLARREICSVLQFVASLQYKCYSASKQVDSICCSYLHVDGVAVCCSVL